MRREERVTVQGPVKEQQPDGMSHRGVQQPPQLQAWGRHTRCRSTNWFGVLQNAEVIPLKDSWISCMPCPEQTIQHRKVFPTTEDVHGSSVDILWSVAGVPSAPR